MTTLEEIIDALNWDRGRLARPSAVRRDYSGNNWLTPSRSRFALAAGETPAVPVKSSPI
jgi:hypothetical protein